MTTAKLLTAPAEGHGLTQDLTDPIWHAKATGKPTDTIVALVVLKPTTIGQSDTKQGTHRHVAFEVQRLEPVLDKNQASELRWLLQALYEQRTSTGEQRMLPISLGSDEERRKAVMERLEDWASEVGKTGAELEQTWREHFGIGPDSEWSFGDAGVPGDYRNASLAHLLSFGYEIGALRTEEPLPHEDREPGEDAAAEDLATDGVGEGACQVCGKDAPRLTDGLCDDCAKSSGIPVPAADSDDDEASA